QSYGIDPGIGNRLTCSFDIRRYILTDQSTTGHKSVGTNLAKLVNSDHTCQYNVVTYGNVTCQSAGVGENTIIADNTIVGNMAISLNEAIASDCRAVTVFRATIDRHTLSDSGIITDLGSRDFSLIFEILRFCRDYRSGEYLTVFAYTRTIHSADVRSNPGPLPNDHIAVYVTEGIDHHIRSDLRFWMDIRQRLYHYYFFYSDNLRH